MPAAATQAYGQPFADTVGGKNVNVVDWNGPKSYVGGTGEAIAPTPFGCQELMFVIGGISVSGTYTVRCEPVGAGVTTWVAQYFTTATGAILGAGPTDLSAETFKLFGYGV